MIWTEYLFTITRIQIRWTYGSLILLCVKKQVKVLSLKKDKNSRVIGIEKLYVSKTVGIDRPLRVELVVD